MAEFLIVGRVEVSVYTKVDAKTLEDAIAVAAERSPMSIIKDGSDSEYECWMLDEIDGEPFGLRQESK